MELSVTIIKNEYLLIQRGGGKGPMKPSNQYILYTMVLNPAAIMLKDKYK